MEPSGRACPGRQRTRHPDTAEHRTVDSAGGNGGPQPKNIDFFILFSHWERNIYAEHRISLNNYAC